MQMLVELIFLHNNMQKVLTLLYFRCVFAKLNGLADFIVY